MVNWDPGSRSAISDLEVEEREVTDTLYWIDYPLEGCNGTVTIATVRPETMLADTAIAVHPDDERYTRLVGETAIAAARRAAAEDHRRPVREARVRHRRAEDHARARPQRLRDRPRPRARGDLGDRRGRPHDRGGRRALRRHDRARGARGRRRGAARGGPDLAHRALHAQRPVLPPLGRADRAADLAAVVHADGRARGARARRRPRRPRPDPPRGPAAALLRVDGEHPALVHLAPAVVGAPDPRLVPRRARPTAGSSRPRARAGSAIPTSSTPGSPPACGRSRRSAGPTTRRSCGRSTRPTCSRRAATSSSCGSPG